MLMSRLLRQCLLALGGFALVAAPTGVCAQSVRSAPAAQARAGGPPWASLSPQQKSVLSPLARDWNELDDSRKIKWIEIADRFHRLPPSEQARIQARMTEWAKMTPSERGRARQNFKDAQQVSPQDRKARWEAYNALPPDRKQELAARGVQPRTDKKDKRREADSGPAGQAGLKLAPSPAARPKPVAPTLSQAQPGATTNLMSKRPTPPAHQQAGLPKIAATPGFVDKSTLLPQRGPQGAAVRSGSPAASRPAKP